MQDAIYIKMQGTFHSRACVYFFIFIFVLPKNKLSRIIMTFQNYVFVANHIDL